MIQIISVNKPILREGGYFVTCHIILQCFDSSAEGPFSFFRALPDT